MPSLSLRERIARHAWRVAPKGLLSATIGWAGRRELPRALQTRLHRLYARAYDVNAAEAELPLEQYRSLQAFFTRRLKPEVRRLPDQPDLVVSPSDGTICEAGLAEAGRLLTAKGEAFTLGDLVADPALALRLSGGPFVAIYLSPRDYHRVHFPASGRVVSWSHIPGKLFPVGSRSVKREPRLFAKNERFVTVVEGPAGLYAVVMVAAVGVGHITASYDPEVATHRSGFSKGAVHHKRFDLPINVERGQELGVFNLGSTTIAIFEPGRIDLDRLVSDAQIRMGTPLGRIIPR